MKKRYAFRLWAPVILLGAATFSQVACSPAKAQASQATTQPLLDKAHALEVRGRMDLAAQTWQQVLLTDPNNTEALGGLARAAKLNGDLKLSATYLDRLRAINPNDPGIARAEQMGTQADHNILLANAGRLAKAGQYAQAMNVYRQVYGSQPPPGDAALAYYETESATSDGRPHAVAALRGLAAKYPVDPRYEVTLGRILTYDPKTRAEGRHLLENHPADPQAAEALRQSLLWDAQNPATASDIRAYLTRHPDAQLSSILEHEPKAAPARPAVSQADRANALVNATRTAEDREAYKALNEKHLDDAETRFKAILNRSPEDGNALAGMGYIRMEQANFGGAISFLVQAKQSGSKDPGLEAALKTSRFWYTMGEGSLALNADNLPTAEKLYRTALEMRPTSTEALEGLGGTLLKAQQPEVAVPVYRQFVKLKPGAPNAWRGLFLAEYGGGDAVKALAVDKQIPSGVRSQLAKDPLYLRSLASAYSTVGRDADAQRVLKTALDLPFPADAHGVETDTRLQYAGLLQQANHFDQAAGLYRQVLDKEPQNVAAYQGLVRVLHAASQDDQAVQTIEAMPPDIYSKAMVDGGFDNTVASIYQAQHRLDVAQDILEKSLQLQTQDGGKPSVPAEIQLAGIYLERGNAALAYPLYQRVLTQFPDRLDVWKGLLNALHATGRDQEALAQIQQMPPKIRADLENDVDFLQTVGSVYAALGQPQQSQVFLHRVEAHYEALHTAAPADVEIQSAWLLYNGGNESALWRQLMQLGGRNDLTDAQRRTVQTIWTSFAVRRANQAAAAGYYKRAVVILNAAARTFPDNPDVIKALAGGYARAGMPKESIAIWKTINMQQAAAADYRSAVGAALAANDTKDAETWLRFGLIQYPSDGSLLVLAARFEQQRGDVNRAADYYKASLKAMPEPDPGAELATELSHAAPSDELPGGRRTNPDLAQLLGPGTEKSAINLQTQPTLQPYLPGGAAGSGMAPVQLNGTPYAPQGDQGGSAPTNQQTAPAKTRLRDYVPHASLNPSSVGISSPTGATATLVVLRKPGPLTESPTGDALTQGATFRTASFIAPQQQTQTTSQPTQNGTIYGPYVPYVPPARTQTNQQQAPAQQVPAAQRQVPQPGFTQPLTRYPSGVPATQPTGSQNSVVYGPYVPYTPPKPTDVQLGNSAPTRQIPQPAVTDVLPTAKYTPGSHTRVNAASRPESAAAARRRAAAAAAASTGQSKPPVEDYSTTPTQPAQYTSPAVQTQRQPAPGDIIQGNPVTSTAPPQQTGDSYGQQYPQPQTGTAPQSSRARSKPRTATAPERTPTLSYPGVGSPLGSQPYPSLGTTYQLPPAPTDQELMEKRLPPLRGGYYTGPVLATNVPLTEREQTERDLAMLEASYSGWVGGTGSARYRSGVIGYDRLSDVEVTAEASFVASNTLRFSVVPKAVFLNSGSLDLTNFSGVNGSPVLGTLNTATATSSPSQQFANGVGGELQVTGNRFALALGYTPYEFLVQNITGRALIKPNSHLSLFASRDAVNETQLSYAGLRDPGTANAIFGGNIWGGVVQTTGGIRFDMGDAKAGFYISGDGGTLTGVHTLDNTKIEGSMGAYFLAHTFPGYGRLNVGVSLFGMHYGQNERPLSYGLGGYFSPEAYILASVPVTFAGRYGNNFHYTIAGSAGVQSFQEDSQLYFPLDRGLQTSFQTLLACTTAQVANHTCGMYPVNSNTGGNYNINAEGAYRIADHWFAGGYLSGNNTNNYNTVSGGFFVRYLFRPQIGTDDYPTGLFPVEGFRPLRIP